MQSKVSGNVASAAKLNTSKSGWANWQIVFDDGNTSKMSFPPDVTYTPAKGDLIGAYEGTYGWVLDCKTFLTEDRTALLTHPGSATQTSSPKTSAPSPSKGARDNYWADKEKYEQEIRDPKIEFQTYFKEILGAYVTALPYLKKKPETLAEVDFLVDDALAKAQAVLDLRKKAEARKDA